MQRVAAQLAGMQKAHMAGIDAAFQCLQVIGFLQAFGVIALVFRHRYPFERRRFRLVFRRAHIRPDDTAALDAGIGRKRDFVPERAVFRFRRDFQAGAVHVELPAVIRAPQTTFLVAAEPQRHAPVGAEFLDQPDIPVAVAKRHQFFRQQRHPDGRAVLLRDFVRQQKGNPVPPEQIAHRRTGARFGDQAVSVVCQQGLVSILRPGLLVQLSVGTRQDESPCAGDVTSITTLFGSRYLRSDSGPAPTFRIWP